MGGFIHFVTSQSGIIAAVVVLVGLAVAVQGLIRPWLADRRDVRNKRPRLVISTLQLSDLKPYSRSRELRFTIGNAGGGEALMTSLRLRVVDHGSSEELRQTVTAAPIDVYEHRVEFKPGKDVYDIRARAFGPAAPPLKYTEGSVDAFVVTLVAKEPQWYRVNVEADWCDVKVPASACDCNSDEVIADFPPSISSTAPPPPGREH
jgi:hypothetical protein